MKEEKEVKQIILFRIFILDKNTKSILLFGDQYLNNLNGLILNIENQEFYNNDLFKKKLLEQIKLKTGFRVHEKKVNLIYLNKKNPEINYELIFTVIITEFVYPENNIPSNSKWWHKNQLRLGQINFISKDEELIVLKHLLNF